MTTSMSLTTLTTLTTLTALIDRLKKLLRAPLPTTTSLLLRKENCIFAQRQVVGAVVVVVVDDVVGGGGGGGGGVSNGTKISHAARFQQLHFGGVQSLANFLCFAEPFEEEFICQYGRVVLGTSVRAVVCAQH